MCIPSRLTIPDPATQPTPVRPVDNILASLLRNFKNLVYKYHEHDSLLENNSAEDLNEQEKADAWDAYEKDVNMKSKFFFVNSSICVRISKLKFCLFIADQFGNVSKIKFYFSIHSTESAECTNMFFNERWCELAFTIGR